MKVFVVGASGYIGKELYTQAKQFFETYGTLSSISKEENTFLPLSLDASPQFDYDLIQKSDVVFLTAAISAPDVCSRKFDHAWAVNVTGTSTFISKVISRGGRIIFFSSDTVYGEKDEIVEESAACIPAGEYAEMKREVEKRFLDSILFKAIRLSYVFSREDKFTKYLIGCEDRGEEAEIFHPFFRAVIHRDEVVAGAIALAQRWEAFPQSIINFGGPEVIARTEFARVLQDMVLPNLRFRVTEPGSDFFKNRPRVIRMKSPVLASLLGRSPYVFREAVMLEFKKNEEKVHD